LWYRVFHSGTGALWSEIVAVDVSPELLDIARSNCSAPNVRYEIENAYDLRYSDSVFDSVVGSSVLDHFEIEAVSVKFIGC